MGSVGSVSDNYRPHVSCYGGTLFLSYKRRHNIETCVAVIPRRRLADTSIADSFSFTVACGDRRVGVFFLSLTLDSSGHRISFPAVDSCHNMTTSHNMTRSTVWKRKFSGTVDRCCPFHRCFHTHVVLRHVVCVESSGVKDRKSNRHESSTQHENSQRVV